MTTPQAAPTPATNRRGRSRRKFLRTALSVCGGALIAAGGADLAVNGVTYNPYGWITKSITSNVITGTGTSGFTSDYQDFLEFLQSVSDKVPGKSVVTSLEAEFAPYALEALDPSFLQYSGIAAGYNPVPYLIQLQEVQFAVSTQSPSYDIFSIDNQNIASFENGIISPIELQQQYPELTYDNYDVNDFMNTVWNYVAEYPPVVTNPTQSGSSSSTQSQAARTSFTLFPFDAPLMVFFYRKDIYDKLGFSPPTTWDEYYSQVQKLGGNGTTFASVSMANGDVSVVYEYLNHLASFGGNMWNVDGNSITPNLTSPECLEALQNYVRFQPYADPGSSNYTWSDQFNSLAQGTSATALLWHDYYEWLNTPSRSPVAAGQFVPALNPAGPAGSFSTYGGAGLGVSAYSKRPEAAYLWIQWATCAGTQEEMLLGQYHNFPTRGSVFNVPQVQQALAAGSLAAFNIAKEAWATGTTALTPFPQWLQVLTNLSVSLHNAWIGYWTPQEALTNAQEYIEQNFPNLTFT